MMSTRLLSLSVASLLVCSGCAMAQNRPPREYDSVKPVQPSAATNVPLPQSVLDALRVDASKRTGIASDQVAVASAEKVTWTDGALGCPQPGRMYTQSLVPGYRVFMRAGERTLLYHTSETDQVVQCPTVSLRPVKPDAPVAQ
jgi:hypothetical protein